MIQGMNKEEINQQPDNREKESASNTIKNERRRKRKLQSKHCREWGGGGKN